VFAGPWALWRSGRDSRSSMPGVSPVTTSLGDGIPHEGMRFDERALRSKYPSHGVLLYSLRFGYRFGRSRLRFISTVIDSVNRVLFSTDIPSRMRLPGSVFFMHNGLGCAIDEGTTFEGSALVMQGVTLGHSFVGRLGAPRIGSRVVIGAGATVVGPVRVGDFVLIGAGAVVSRDVPSFHKAIGNPAVISPLDRARIDDVWSAS
jgi:serine O-acetyltransferase